MSATATPDQLVDRPLATTFLASRSDLRLVKIPRRSVRNATGDTIGETPGETIQFVPYDDPTEVNEHGKPKRYGRFECPLEGTVTLEDGRETDAADVLAFLHRHKMNGNLVEGFWLFEREAPAPSREELDRLMEAAFDEELLQEIIDQERQGWARPALLEVADGALTRLRALKAEAAEQAAAAQREPQPADAPAKTAARAKK